MRIGAVLLGLLALTPVAMSFGGEIDNAGSVLPGGVPFPSGGERPPRPLLLVEVLAHAPQDDEYVVLANPGTHAVNVVGWSLSDGEGVWTLPPLLVPAGDAVLVTRNATALRANGGLEADACVSGCDTLLTVRGSLALRDQGDGLQLIDPEGRLVDAFLYGAGALPGWIGDPVASLGKGLVARRRVGENGWLDTDTSADWSWNRTFRLGQSRRLPAIFEHVLVRPLLSPNDSREGLLTLIGRAQYRVTLAGFTLTDPVIAEALRAAIGRGLHVQIGVEASPPGGMGPVGEQILEDLGRAGARVLLMGSHGVGAWRRYALHHAKYVLVDDAWVVLGSENFSPTGYPAQTGNRGWNVAVRSPALAAWFREVWTGDWDVNRSDVRSLSGTAGPGGDGARRLTLGLAPALPRVNVTAFLGPDNAAAPGGLPGILHRARETLDVQLFYLRWMWGAWRNPLVAELLEAAARGVSVRILLDGQPYNVEGKEDNDEAVGRLNRLAVERSLPLEARIFPGDPDGIVKLHNKGLLVDGERVWVSSMNWNLAGAFANREAALLVDSHEVAAVFQHAFDEDWTKGIPLGRDTPPLAPEGDLLLWIGLGSAAAAGAWWWALRTTKEPTNKHPQKGRTWRQRFKRLSSRFRRRRSRSTRIAR
jgi:phosphatidylserine/phosphatidylglycerophosphate/cardiolipin synthase-like enzyme